MGKLSASGIIKGMLVGICLSLGGMAQAQSPAAPSSITAPPATPVAPMSARPPTPGLAQPAMKPGAAQPARKYDRSYAHCKARAFRRGLKGVERRAFILRCQLGFAPMKSQVAPAAVPPGTPVPPQVTPPPARK